ncbi:hypothetical protein KA012_02480 [Candidatus Woesebacteria bacterium]|nr:hypothetical protein [Candidatus Woesebacteria bacterium]
MIKTDFQRLADSFSVGTVTSCKAIGKPISISNYVLNPVVGKRETATGLLSLYTLHTTKGFFVLAGATPLAIDDAVLKQQLKSHLDLTYFEYLPTQDKLKLTHKNDLYWYLIQPYKLLDREKAIEQLESLTVGQPIAASLGYGGVLFIEIGEALEPVLENGMQQPYRKIGMFVEEWWELRHQGKTIATRFDDTPAEEYFEQIAGKKIGSFTISPDCKKTSITVGEYTIVIPQTEQLVTWSLSHRTQGFEIHLTGTKRFKIKNYFFQRPGRSGENHPTRPETLFDQFYREDLPISQDNVNKLMQPMLGGVVQEVREMSGVDFCLELSGKEKWLLSVDSEWSLSRGEKSILSSKSHRFVFLEPLTKYLLQKKLTNILLQKEGTTFTFGTSLHLVIKQQKTLRLWWCLNRSKNISISARGNGTFEHVLWCPPELQEKYLQSKYGSTAADLLYSLEVYRDLLAA